jgi:hypothetical protein
VCIQISFFELFLQEYRTYITIICITVSIFHKIKIIYNLSIWEYSLVAHYLNLISQFISSTPFAVKFYSICYIGELLFKPGVLISEFRKGIFRHPDADPKTGYKKHEPWNHKSYTFESECNGPIYYAKDPLGNKFCRFIYSTYKRIEWHVFLTPQDQKEYLQKENYLNKLKEELAYLIRTHENAVATGTAFQNIRPLERRVKILSHEIQELEDLNVCWFDQHELPDDFYEPDPSKYKVPSGTQPNFMNTPDSFKVRIFHFEMTRYMMKRFLNGPFYKWWTQSDVESRSWDVQTGLHTIKLKERKQFKLEGDLFDKELPDKDSQLRKNMAAYMQRYPTDFERFRTKNREDIFQILVDKGYIKDKNLDPNTFFDNVPPGSSTKTYKDFDNFMNHSSTNDFERIRSKHKRETFQILVNNRYIILNQDVEEIHKIFDRWKHFPSEKKVITDHLKIYPIKDKKHVTNKLRREFYQILIKKGMNPKNCVPKSTKKQKSYRIQFAFTLLRTLLSVFIPRIFNKKK